MADAIMLNPVYDNYQIYTASVTSIDVSPNIITAIETKLGISGIKRVVNLGTPQDGVYFVSVIETGKGALRKNASESWGFMGTSGLLRINQGDKFIIMT